MVALDRDRLGFLVLPVEESGAKAESERNAPVRRRTSYAQAGGWEVGRWVRVRRLVDTEETNDE